MATIGAAQGLKGEVRVNSLTAEPLALVGYKHFTDSAGRTHMLDYQMVETPEGWQINAVELLKAAGVGA